MDRNYDDPQYKKWRKAIARRDGFACQWPRCGSNQRLRFHHIRKWVSFPNLRFELDNGLTLCKHHHDLIWGEEELYARMLQGIVSRINDTGRPIERAKCKNNKRNSRTRRQKDINKIRGEIRRWVNRKGDTKQ